MLLKPCNATKPRQLGWAFGSDGTIRTKTGSCVTAALPMYEAVLLPCNGCSRIGPSPELGLQRYSGLGLDFDHATRIWAPAPHRPTHVV